MAVRAAVVILGRQLVIAGAHEHGHHAVGLYDLVLNNGLDPDRLRCQFPVGHTTLFLFERLSFHSARLRPLTSVCNSSTFIPLPIVSSPRAHP